MSVLVMYMYLQTGLNIDKCAEVDLLANKNVKWVKSDMNEWLRICKMTLYTFSRNLNWNSPRGMTPLG